MTIQHDTTPCHVSRLIWKYLEENDIFMMEWPALGHDLNIIVNIWLSVKRKTQSDVGEIKSKEDIIERFRSACNKTTQLEIEKLYGLYLPIVKKLSLTRDSCLNISS